MYSINGTEYTELFRREFTDSFVATESSGKLLNKFACHSSVLKHSNFDVLHFRANFLDDIRIHRFQSATHVSLHFQLNGRSDARISGFPADVPMAKGEFNVMNCVQPESTFTFPKQQQYEYICIGLKPSFFQDLLLSCGNEYAHLFKNDIDKQSFSLFAGNRQINQWLRSNLGLLVQSPVPQGLLLPYLQAKISELTILALASGNPVNEQQILNAADKEKLYAVKNYLSASFLANLSLTGIAQQFAINEFKLKKGFREMFGTTVFGYLCKLRMEHAYYLVCQTDLPIGEVAAIVSYHSDAAFIRAFRQTFGSSPGQLSKRASRQQK
ncbi:helix-turn-helix transcriptional regulator [Mucilaginibacter sp. X4EP1]|jgi:AraC family transcriptional regulator, transcriptional activator of the genes for pyochelin and ferripyochelin receptors|uniref:helix-turn-helix transcriptional regulator n=1 Tax=Mucilaginibacter sp. X4EP1 TaxID=2723092 RepID=UPI002169D1E0|nr:AraC family transcriptional regulator [Mucilaginibacter sp. X4EP1]MCS3811598.1 AraC-like DNA-binding protein [Mucilaginibacter sp. X4EP1]